ncbi:MAG TPA: SigE family RNA polymerase sigma factor [Nocardioidaceae bacterium]|nr:SigE family RNA polymerase sigma factor [Nocardioidaceae bacterium]
MDDTDFDEFVRARWPKLVRSAILLGCSPTEAEDVVQAALTRCLVNWTKVVGAHDIDAYVHRILINSFTSSRRRLWVREQPTTDLEAPASEDMTERVERSDALLRSLRKLGSDQRAVVVLRYYVQLNEQQTAAVLGVPVGTVKSRLSRALSALACDPALAEMKGTQ